MKLFLYIFGIYMLALSTMPCSDAYNDCDNNTRVTERRADHNHNADQNDVCAPFCTCTCCSTTVNPRFAALKIQTSKPVAVSEITYPFYSFSLLSNYYGNIWQPPKINA